MFELVFITSSSAKLDHARHLCRGYAIRISKQKNYGIGYKEPRIHDRIALIDESVKDAIERFKKNVPNYQNKFFFIEDTSVIIPALSTDREYPGVDIKYWMKENTFSSVDEMLNANGNDRRVRVRSDIALVLSKDLSMRVGKEYMVFTSFHDGIITDKEYEMKTQPLYPWLSSQTFNKWFIPQGCTIPVSMLDIDDADSHDFRSGAFKEMLDFLHENRVIETRQEYQLKKAEQLNLFEPFVFIICGPTCAGKTTLANFLADKYQYYHLEASDFMYLSWYEKHGIRSEVSIGDFAEEALKKNPAIVADQIIRNIQRLHNIPIVITGFRDPKEIDRFMLQYGGDYFIKPVYVDADQLERFKRSLIRDRQDKVADFEKFQQKDEQQHNMGLRLIKQYYQDAIIYNDASLEDYFDVFKALFSKQLAATETIGITKPPNWLTSKRLQNAIIKILFKQPDQERYYTTTEIAHLINSDPEFKGNTKSKNNISRYFNQDFHPYFEIKMNEEDIATYRLSQTGMAYARFL